MDHFWEKNISSQKIQLSHTTSCGFLTPFKTYRPIRREFPDSRVDRWKDKQTEGQTDRPYFIESFQKLPEV